LHYGEVVLVSKSLEIDELLISTYFHEPIIDLGLAGDTEVIGLLLPLEEEGEELLAHHSSHDEAGSQLVFDKEGALTIRVKLLSVSDGDINVFIDSDVKGHELHLLAVLSELIEAVLEDESIVDLDKLNSGHIRLHQMSIVMNMVLPSLHE
jgi:hypothetical protein